MDTPDALAAVQAAVDTAISPARAASPVPSFYDEPDGEPDESGVYRPRVHPDDTPVVMFPEAVSQAAAASSQPSVVPSQRVASPAPSAATQVEPECEIDEGSSVPWPGPNRAGAP